MALKKLEMSSSKMKIDQFKKAMSKEYPIVEKNEETTENKEEEQQTNSSEEENIEDQVFLTIS